MVLCLCRAQTPSPQSLQATEMTKLLGKPCCALVGVTHFHTSCLGYVPFFFAFAISTKKNPKTFHQLQLFFGLPHHLQEILKMFSIGCAGLTLPLFSMQGLAWWCDVLQQVCVGVFAKIVIYFYVKVRPSFNGKHTREWWRALVIGMQHLAHQLHPISCAPNMARNGELPESCRKSWNGEFFRQRFWDEHLQSLTLFQLFWLKCQCSNALI